MYIPSRSSDRRNSGRYSICIITLLCFSLSEQGLGLAFISFFRFSFHFLNYSRKQCQETNYASQFCLLTSLYTYIVHSKQHCLVCEQWYCHQNIVTRLGIEPAMPDSLSEVVSTTPYKCRYDSCRHINRIYIAHFNISQNPIRPHKI